MTHIVHKGQAVAPMPTMAPARRPEPAAPSIHPDEAVVDFLNRYHGLKDLSTDLTEALNRVRTDLAMTAKKLEVADAELRRSQIARDEYQRGYFELQAQMSVMATASIAAAKQIQSSAESICQQIAETAIKCLETAKSSMIRAQVDSGTGEVPLSQEAEDAIDRSLAEIGRKFGANARAEESDI